MSKQVKTYNEIEFEFEKLEQAFEEQRKQKEELQKFFIRYLSDKEMDKMEMIKGLKGLVGLQNAIALANKLLKK